MPLGAFERSDYRLGACFALLLGVVGRLTDRVSDCFEGVDIRVEGIPNGVGCERACEREFLDSFLCGRGIDGFVLAWVVFLDSARDSIRIGPLRFYTIEQPKESVFAVIVGLLPTPVTIRSAGYEVSACRSAMAVTKATSRAGPRR